VRVGDETTPLVVYLVVRQSPDCAPMMVEVIGACMTLADADALREYEYERTGRRCHVEWLYPEESVEVVRSARARADREGSVAPDGRPLPVRG